jgi:hypothetical protein
MKLPLTVNDVIITLTAEEEDMGVRGNYVASGDDEQDKEDEDEIIRDYESGNLWAWCVAHVTVRPKDGRLATFSGDDYLGGCSYANEQDFKEGGYYEDMVNTALSELNRLLMDVHDALLGD